jgi:hypothetical protein
MCCCCCCCCCCCYIYICVTAGEGTSDVLCQYFDSGWLQVSVGECIQVSVLVDVVSLCWGRLTDVEARNWFTAVVSRFVMPCDNSSRVTLPRPSQGLDTPNVYPKPIYEISTCSEVICILQIFLKLLTSVGEVWFGFEQLLPNRKPNHSVSHRILETETKTVWNRFNQFGLAETQFQTVSGYIYVIFNLFTHFGL